MHIASANGYSKVVEFLLENHAAVDAVDKDLWTPAHAAACWGHVRIYNFSRFSFYITFCCLFMLDALFNEPIEC